MGGLGDSGGGLFVQLPRSAELPDEGIFFFSLYLGLTDYDDQVNGTVHIVRKHEDHKVALRSFRPRPEKC